MVRIAPDTLESFARELVVALGTSDRIAGQVAASLVAADLRGHDSHGVLRVPIYGRWIEEGRRIDPGAEPEVVREATATATVEGHRAFGQATGRVATDLGIEKAREAGVAAIGIRNGAHLGRLGEWAERAAETGLIFCACVAGSTPTVAPAGSYQRRFSTNPVAFGVPTFDALDFPMVLDMATSQVAHGKIRKLAVTGDPIPEEWTVSESGEAVTDAEAFRNDGEGAILPLGGRVSGYKGFGLSLMSEVIGSTLGDAPVSGQPGAGEGGNDAAFLLVDPLEFTTREAHAERMRALDAYVKDTDYPEAMSAGVAAREGEGLLPGEPEHRAAEAARDGVDLADRIAVSLCDLARERGLEGSIPGEFEGLE